MLGRLILLLVIALWPCTVRGQWYVGAGLAQAEPDQAIPFGFPPDTTSNDGADSVWKLFGGYRFAQNFAVEFGTADLGDDYTIFNLLGADETITLVLGAYNISLVGGVSVSPQIDLLGRVGVAFWEVELAYEEGTFVTSGLDEGVDLLGGLGLEWHASRAFGVRLEWEQFQNIGDEVRAGLPSHGDQRCELSGQDINVWGVSIVYRFKSAG